jgi:hypothetical protein
MTDQELKKLRDLCEKATPGPWKNDCGNGQVETEEDRVIICNRCGNYDRLLDCFGMYGIRNEEDTDILNAKKQLPEDIQQLLKYDNEDDMEFIAEARTAIPKLLDEVERLKVWSYESHVTDLEEENARLKETLSDIVKHYGHPIHEDNNWTYYAIKLAYKDSILGLLKKGNRPDYDAVADRIELAREALEGSK